MHMAAGSSLPEEGDSGGRCSSIRPHICILVYSQPFLGPDLASKSLPKQLSVAFLDIHPGHLVALFYAGTTAGHYARVSEAPVLSEVLGTQNRASGVRKN